MLGKRQEKTTLRRSRRRWEGRIKIGLTEVGLEGVDWFLPAQDRDLRRALVMMVIVIAGKPQGRRQIVRPRRRWEE